MRLPKSDREAEKDRQFAATLANGIDILLAFRVGESLLGNKTLAERTGLSRPTVARLTYTLCQLGYLRADTKHRKYRLGAATLSVAYPVLVNLRVRQISHPMLKALADHIDGIASLGHQTLNHMIYVETAVSTDAAELKPDVGATFPMLITASGRAWLNVASPSASSAVLNRLRIEDPQTFARMADKLDESRVEFKQRGYCVSRGDWHPEVLGLAVPLCKPIDGQWFVVNCAIHTAPESFGMKERIVAEHLLKTARRLEAVFGLGPSRLDDSGLD